MSSVVLSIFCAPRFHGQMERPSFLAKVDWMTLTSLLELSRANTDFFRKVMGYQMQRTCAKFVPKFSSLFSPFSPVSLVSALLEAFSLSMVTSVKGVESNTSFWIFFLRTLSGIMPLPIIVKRFDLKDIFPFFFDDVDVSTYCKGVMAMTLFLATSVPRISFMILVFLASLALISGRLLVLATRYVSGKSVS